MKRYLFTGILPFSIALSMGSSLQAETLATVSGQNLTSDEFKQEMEKLGPQAMALKDNPTARKRFLDQLITIKLLEGAGKKAGLENSKDFLGKMDSIKRQVLAQTYLEDFVTKSMTDAAMNEHFKKYANRFSGEEVCASHILFKAEKKDEADKVLVEALKPGAKFDELAKKHSTDSNGPRGGDLGCFGRGRMVPEFEAVAFTTAKDKIHDKLVKTDFGFHIIKVTDVKKGKDVKFADVKDQVRADMERSLRTDLIANLKSDAKVTVDDKAVESMKL